MYAMSDLIQRGRPVGVTLNDGSLTRAVVLHVYSHGIDCKLDNGCRVYIPSHRIHV